MFQELPLKPRKVPAFLSRGKRKGSLIELVPAGKLRYSYMMSCSQIKDLIVFMIKLLTPCTKNYEESCRIHSMGFMTSSRLVMKHFPTLQLEKDAGLIVSLIMSSLDLVSFPRRYWEKNMNLVYGLAIHEFSVAQVDRTSARCLGDHRFESCRGLRFSLCPTLVTCWFFTRYWMSLKRAWHNNQPAELFLKILKVMVF